MKTFINILAKGINQYLLAGALFIMVAFMSCKKEKVPAGTTYATGQSIELTVTEHDQKRHRIILTPVLKEKPLMYR